MKKAIWLERTAAKQIPHVNHSCKRVQYCDGLLMRYVLVAHGDWVPKNMRYCGGRSHTFPLFLFYARIKPVKFAPANSAKVMRQKKPKDRIKSHATIALDREDKQSFSHTAGSHVKPTAA